MQNRTYETKLEGFAICLANCEFRGEIVVRAFINVKATYTEDWDFDKSYGWHDLGTFDYDLNDAELIEDEIFEIVTTRGFKEVEGKIKLIKVLDYDLDEVDR